MLYGSKSPQSGYEEGSEPKIILEPDKKNTAPAILSSVLIKDIPLHQPMIFFSSDNLLGKVNQFNKTINFYKEYLNKNNIFIFGIKTTSPSSEYGYFITKKISTHIKKVIKFIEKPNSRKVREILKKKGFMNSGIFFARKDSIIKSFIKYQHRMFKYCNVAVAKSKFYKNVYNLNRDSFRKLPNISFDYAILEKSNDIYAIKLNSPLTDLGNWKEIWKFFKEEISKKSIKSRTFHRPWGKYINLFSGKGFLLKELVIYPNSSISLQKHNHRSERWTIISGKPKIIIDKKIFFGSPNETVVIPKRSVHRIENIYRNPVVIMEVQIGKIIRETDIIRYKDIYGRIN